MDISTDHQSQTKSDLRLPIDSYLTQIINSLVSENKVLICAPPGSGKTTRVPLALMNEIKGKIIVVQPRRVAVRSVAEWMSSKLNQKVGEQIGYQVRFEKKISKHITTFSFACAMNVAQ